MYTPRSCLDPVRLRQRRFLKLGFLALHERRIIRDAAAVHVLTDVERGQALRQGARPNQCVVIPNGAEFDPDADFPDGNVFRKHARVDPDAPLVLFMGRLHRVKGLDLLVDAFARLRAHVPAAQLVIAGPDEGERPAIEARGRRLGIADAVHLTGRLDGDLRLSAFRAADVFALTSYSEGMPNAVLEACAAGTPVLISDRCNMPEVRNWAAGRVVSADAGAIATGLREMLADPAALRAMGGNARRMVREQFSWPTVIGHLDTLYQRLTSGSVASDDLDVATARAA